MDKQEQNRYMYMQQQLQQQSREINNLMFKEVERMLDD